MRIYVKVRSLQRSRKFLESKPYEIPDGTDALRKLLCALVAIEVYA